jgi:dienelactone hydrolase
MSHRRNRHLPVWLTLAAGLIFLASVRANAQTGGYTTYVGGKAIIVDQFQATKGPRGELTVTATLSSPGAAEGQNVVTTLANHRPVSFALSYAGNVLISAKFNGTTVTVHRPNQADREIQTKATMVLENMLWHQFVFLIDQYDETKGGEQTFVAFLPSQGIDYPIVMTRVGTPEYQTSGKTIKTRQYHLLANNAVTLEVWTDEAGIPMLLQNAAQQLKVLRTDAENLADVALTDTPKAAAYQPPPYAVPSAFREQDVTVGANTEWGLPGTLTMPVGPGPFPALVLVHGSGPNDRDETLGPNKPFQDLAWGLASQGIAVLRYDKRTRVYPGKSTALPSLTVKQETVDDALAAVALVSHTPQIDPKKIYLLGHSLGGALVPRIGIADQNRIAGFIVFAGATRPLEDEWVRQYQYIYGLQGKITPQQQAEIDGYKRQAARIKQLTQTDAGSKELLLAGPPSYWLDLRGYFPPEVALKLKQPMLVLQGQRDYNVTMDAFDDWQRTLASRTNVTLKSYPKLDHLFLEGTGPASGADYAHPRNIPKYVIDDIATWIKSKLKLRPAGNSERAAGSLVREMVQTATLEL